ncbi:MAG: hypothetical protein AAAB13_09900 [Pseudomonas sp.]
MRQIWIGLLALVLTGCSSSLVDYSPQGITEPEAHAVIEQMILAQPGQLRPDSVYIDNHYMGFNDPGAAGVPVTPAAEGTAARNDKRIYFNSIASVQLYQLFNRYTVQLFDADGQALIGFASESQGQAQRFIDALQFYRNQAPATDGLN